MSNETIPDDVDVGDISKYQTEKIRVLVGLNGSFDSSVTAFLLKKQGFQVVGLGIITWDENDPLKSKLKTPNCHIQNLEGLKNFCESLDIPFYAADAKAQYENDVLEFAMTNKVTGRSINSCINCNQLRFEILYAKMKKLNCHFIATGHYAKTYKNHQTNEFFIHSANDKAHDQSFLVSGIRQEILKKLLLPLSELKRSEVDKIAKNFSLTNFAQYKSQLECFLEDEVFPKYIEKKVPARFRERGNMIDIENDSFISDHEGFHHFHIAQKNIKLDGGKKSIDRNLAIVDFNYHDNQILLGKDEATKTLGVQVIKVLFSSEVDRTKPLKVFAKMNNSIDFYKATLYYKNNDTLYLELEKAYEFLAENHKIVFYDKDAASSRVLGVGYVATRGLYNPTARGDEFRNHGKKSKNPFEQAKSQEQDEDEVKLRF